MAKSLKGKRVLLTGGANGIGLCLARLLVKDGARLIISDIDAGALERARAQLAGELGEVFDYAVDVSDRAAVETMADWVKEQFGGLDILINNAGIGHSGEFIETPLEKWKKLMDVNFWGPLYHVYAFLPQLIESSEGQIVNVSSGQAFFRLPTWGPYAVIKLALGGFSELLRFEMRKFNVAVTTVYPFMVNTGFYKDIEGETLGAKLSMKLMPYYSMSPDRVARIMFKAIKKKKAVEMVSALNDFAYYARAVPKMSDLISFASLLVLGKSVDELKPLSHEMNG
jgi:NAD(P)-dependent dehydrogenase (short-subunit alcohol dehydrogenase family)